MPNGWYYLHVNGDLIFKPDDPGREQDFRDSDMVRKYWPFDPQRETAWRILIEAGALGAARSRIDELATHWRCNDTDAEEYAERAGLKLERAFGFFCYGHRCGKVMATRRGLPVAAGGKVGLGDCALDALTDLRREETEAANV